MTNYVGTQERKEQAYVSYHEDGLLDLLIGLAVLLGGLYILVDLDIPLAGGWVVLWLPIWLSARKTITSRRLQQSRLRAPGRYFLPASCLPIYRIVRIAFPGGALPSQSSGKPEGASWPADPCLQAPAGPGMPTGMRRPYG